MSLDIVTLEVIRNALPAIANEMSYVLQRTSYNMMIYEVRDYCCGLVDTAGRLLSQNTGGVSHFVADLGVVIQDGVRRFGLDGFRLGDVIITNHQRVAGQHLNNIMVYTPCFAGGELAGFAVTRAHWIDVGGVSTGFGAGNNAIDPWIEGLQLDQIKLYEAGVLDEKVWRIIRDNIRFPESSMGDLKSQIAACRLAERRLEELVERYQRDVVQQAIERIFDQTEGRCRAAIARLPDGVYEAESLFGGHSLDNDEPVRIHAKVTIRESDMEIDLTGCSLQRRQPVNARTLAAPLIAYKAITMPNDPVNEGAFRALRVKIQEGNYMMAPYPAPMASWGRTLPTVVDTILSALAPILPDKIPAAHLGVLGGTVVFFGEDPGTAKRFVTQSIEGGGWGARPWEDGESGAVSVCQGDVHNAPIEKMELRWPILVERRELRCDSGGPGQYRGGLGIEIQVKGLVDGYWSLADTGRHQFPPWGADGGGAGKPSDSLARLPGEADFAHVDLIRHEVPAGTEAIVITAGGGGWGDPFLRDPEKVRLDVLEGYVSLEAAKESYGVELHPGTLEIDEQATFEPPLPEMTALIALAEFVQSRDLGELPPARFELLKLHLADTLGAADLVGASTCAAIRSTEIDDIHLTSCTTPGSVIMPTCLALGTPTVSNYFAAVAAGYEVLIRLGRAINGPAILRKRIWPTYFCAALGSAAAASRSFGLSVEKTAGALSTALTLSVGTSSPARSPEASRWMTLGVAASNGVLAATAARNGLVGPNDLFEQHLGRIAGVRISRKVLLEDLGRSYFLDEVGMKPFPTARQGLAAIEACRELVAAEKIDVESVQEIVVGVPESQRWVIDHPDPPSDRMASIVSAQYQIALALLSPVRLTGVRRSPVFLNDRIRALMTKVTVRRAAHLEKHYPAAWPAQVTIKLKGRRLQHTILHPRGDANNPLGWNDLARKYKGCDFLNQVRSLQSQDSMPKLWEASH